MLYDRIPIQSGEDMVMVDIVNEYLKNVIKQFNFSYNYIVYQNIPYI